MPWGIDFMSKDDTDVLTVDREAGRDREEDTDLCDDAEDTRDSDRVRVTEVCLVWVGARVGIWGGGFGSGTTGAADDGDGWAAAPSRVK